jgi:hypothetical protein
MSHYIVETRKLDVVLLGKSQTTWRCQADWENLVHQEDLQSYVEVTCKRLHPKPAGRWDSKVVLLRIPIYEMWDVEDERRQLQLALQATLE